EFVMLKQVMQWRLLAIVFLMLLIAFTIVGWLLNAMY
ncbi:MAG: permease, partial [Geobacter sp.]